MHKIKLQNAIGLLESMTYGSSKGWISIEPSELKSSQSVFGVNGTLLIFHVPSSVLESVVASTKSVLELLLRIVSPDKVERLHTLKLFDVESELAKVSISKVAPEVLHAMRSFHLENV